MPDKKQRQSRLSKSGAAATARILLERQTESDAASKQRKTLVERAVGLNQQSEQIQQEIQGLNIVSENATNKCCEITYDAQPAQ